MPLPKKSSFKETFNPPISRHFTETYKNMRTETIWHKIAPHSPFLIFSLRADHVVLFPLADISELKHEAMT